MKKHTDSVFSPLQIIKLLSLLLCAVLSWNMAAGLLNVVDSFTENPSYTSEVFRNFESFDYEKSKPFQNEVHNLIDNILNYSLVYETGNGFESDVVVTQNINDAVNSAERQIGDVTYLAESQIEQGELSPDYVKNGFIAVSESPDGGIYYNGKRCFASVDKEKIRSFYETRRDESIKVSKLLNRVYRDIYNYIESLDSVSFRVVNKENGKVISNAENIPSSPKYCITFGGAQGGTINDFSNYISSVRDKYPNFELTIAFENLIFNDECNSIEQRFNETRMAIILSLIRAAVCLAGMILLLVFLVRVAGKKTLNGEVQRSRSDKIPFSIRTAAYLFLMSAAVLIILIQLSFVFNRSGVPDWIKPTNDLKFLIIKECVVAFTVYLSGFLTMIKRKLATKKSKKH